VCKTQLLNLLASMHTPQYDFFFVRLVATCVHEISHALRSRMCRANGIDLEFTCKTPGEFALDENEFGIDQDGNVDSSHGEGGYWMEHKIFGGRVNLLVTPDEWINAKETEHIQGVVITRASNEHFQLNDELLQAIIANQQFQVEILQGALITRDNQILNGKLH